MFSVRFRKWMTGLTAVFAIAFLLGMPAAAKADWQKKGDSWYYYDSEGKKVTKSWIEGKYYVGKSGARVTGLTIIKKKRYYFDKSGVLLKKYWIKTKSGNLYYAGKDGQLYTGGIYKIKGQYYYFNSTGVCRTGLRTVNGKTYYFWKKTGYMLKKTWVKIKSKLYYFGSSGKMQKKKWVGYYYVGADGARKTDCWKGSRYLGSDGEAVSGLQKIDGSYYYFDPSNRKKVTSTTLEVDGEKYKFDSNGVGTKVKKETSKAPATSASVQPEYYSHKYVDDETLLASIIYCEAGNQSYTGQLAVGLVILNRVNDSRFPNKFREVIYAKGQFNPTWDGALKRALENPSLVTDSCRKAAKAVMKVYKNYTSGKKIYLKINGKKTLFPHLFFMTEGSYKRLGLGSKYVQIGAHVFFQNWG